MLNRYNHFTYSSFINYRKYINHYTYKVQIQNHLSALEKILSQSMLLVTGSEQKGDFNQQAQKQIFFNCYQILLELQQQQQSSLSRNAQNNSFHQHIFPIFQNYHKLLGFIFELLCIINNSVILKLYLEDDSRKNILRNIIRIIQIYVKFDFKKYQVIQELSVQIQKIHMQLKIYCSQTPNQLRQSSIKRFLRISYKIVRYFKIYTSKLKNYCLFIKEIGTMLNKITQDIQQKQLDLLIHNIQLKIFKQILSVYIEDYLKQKQRLTYKCLNCEKSFEHYKLLKHVEICKKKYQCDRLLQTNFKQIEPRLLDLNGILPTIQNLYKQKTKTTQSILNRAKKSQFFFNKNLSKTTNYNKKQKALEINSQFDSSIGSDDQGSIKSTEQIKKTKLKKIEELSSTQLKQLIKIIQKIQSIGQKIKTSRQSTNLLLFYDLRDVKNSLQKSFNNLSVDCLEVKIFIKLLLQRYNLMQNLKKNTNKAKQSGFDTQQQYLSLQNVDITAVHTQPKKQLKFRRKKYNEAQDIYFSQQQSFIPSNSMFQQKSIGVEQFEIIKTLGNGKFATVFLVKKKTTKQNYAMKRIHIQNYKQYYQTKKMNQNLENQQCVFQITNNPFVIKAFYSFSQDQYHYFIMEYCPNGDFQRLLTNQCRLLQSQAKLYLAEIVQALDYLHKNSIIHRDLKPHNIVIDENWHLKITDYGLSDAGIKNKKKQFDKVKNLSKFAQQSRKLKTVNENKKKRGIIGSPIYMAPQVFKGEPATYMSDWWSFGVILYQTLIGALPFMGQRQQIQQQIFKKFVWSSEVEFGYGQDQISYEAKDLIQKLLVIQPKQRIGNNINDIKDHKFFDGINWDHLLDQKPPVLLNRQEDSGQQCDQNVQFDKYSQTKSSKSFSRELLVRRDLLNSDTESKYKARQIHYQKLRRLAKNMKKFQLQNLL